jgi:hypothetical protein
MNLPPENSPALERWETHRQNKSSPARDGRNFLSSLTGLVPAKSRLPSAKALGYYHGTQFSFFHVPRGWLCWPRRNRINPT